MKKGIFLISIIVLLVACWSAVWFFVAGKVETAITDTKIKLADKGRDFECTNQQVDGYPFRISLNCDQLRYSDQSTGLEIQTGKLKSAAQAYQPNKAIVELTSPANITLPNGNRFDTTWNSMRSSLKVGLSGPENISLQGKELKLAPANDAAQTMLMQDIQVHGRKVGDDNVNLAVSLNEASSQSGLWPTFNLKTAFLLENSYQDLLNRTSLLRLAKSKGLKGKIEEFQYSPVEGGMLEITGPAQVSPQGLLSGNFDVKVRDLPKLINALSKSFPQEQQKFQDISGAISLLTGNSDKEISLPISLRKGRISIGILPVANLPPLF